MTGKTHVAIGLAGALALAAAGHPPPGALAWGAVVVGSLAPDIDSGGGTIARPGSLFKRLLPRWVTWLLDAIGLAISGLIRAALGHRTATHWPVWGALLVMGGLGLGWPALSWFGVGYLLHIAGDFCTKSGVPLFGPFFTGDIRWSPLRTGTWPEMLLSAGLWLWIGYVGYSRLPEPARAWLWQFGGQFINLVR